MAFKRKCWWFQKAGRIGSKTREWAGLLLHTVLKSQYIFALALRGITVDTLGSTVKKLGKVVKSIAVTFDVRTDLWGGDSEKTGRSHCLAMQSWLSHSWFGRFCLVCSPGLAPQTSIMSNNWTIELHMTRNKGEKFLSKAAFPTQRWKCKKKKKGI